MLLIRDGAKPGRGKSRGAAWSRGTGPRRRARRAATASRRPGGEIAARYTTPPGIAFLPLPDAPPLEWALTWRSDTDTPALRALAETAAALGPIAL
ncbi:hypothetical protein GCM10022221_07310 [Actinocorallia aurea]